ncbi:MAG TPA: PH domain-containing protein, partial [Longimicrobium sp.]|nr:PH domain-containing protein [Longimicrobium sp.]
GARMPSEAAAHPGLAGGGRLHPLTVGFAAFGIARQFLWPALLGGFSMGDGELGRALPWFLLMLSIPSLIGASLKYATFRYGLAGDELTLRSGVLSRRHRVIPVSRVQNVEVRQNLAARVCGVAELRVETAGSGAEAEAVLAVIAAADAQRLRTELLARRRAAMPVAAAVGGADAADPAEAAPPLARLAMGDLVLAGATANEAGVIAAALLGSLQVVEDVPFLSTALQGLLEAAPVEPSGPGLVLVVAGAAVLLLLAGWIISVIGAVVRYYGFTLRRDGGELRKRYGLLTVHEASVPLERVQAIRVEESVLRRPLALASLMIETAGGTPGQQGGAEAFVPLAARTRVAGLVRGIWEEMDFDAVELRKVHPLAVRRMAWRYLVAMAWFGSVGVFGTWMAGLVTPTPELGLALLVPVLVLPWLLARWQYAHRGWALVPGFMIARSGAFNRVTWIVPDRKLQTLHRTSSPFQRRLGLASLVVDTAAGGRQAAVIDLAEEDAEALLEALAERVRAAALTLTLPASPARDVVAPGEAGCPSPANGAGEGEGPRVAEAPVPG